MLSFYRRAKFDYLDKAFCILSLNDSDQQGEEVHSNNDDKDVIGPSEGGDEKSTSRLIKRVDFIVSPPEQYAFALVSWTGSKVTPYPYKPLLISLIKMKLTNYLLYTVIPFLLHSH